MPGKVTITIIAKYHTTKELEEECHEMIEHWLDANRHIIFVVPSDQTVGEILEEYVKTGR